MWPELRELSVFRFDDDIVRRGDRSQLHFNNPTLLLPAIQEIFSASKSVPTWRQQE